MFNKNDFNYEEGYLEPIMGSAALDEPLPLNEIPKLSSEPRIAYRLIKDQLIDEGIARQNLATFCQTYMEPEAVKIMADTMDKNAIDKTEYPRTAEIENRCVNMIANLWNAPKDMKYLGTSTVGSSEGCMLGGLAMKFDWRERAKKLGIDINAKKPNLVITSAYQVVWEKFCVYWDVELRQIPIDEEYGSINPEVLLDYVDEYTIGVVGILGITYTGKYDDIEAMDKKLREYNKNHDMKVYIHVDAASGGLYTPFIEPELPWDFRLETVHSISCSGHKYGLVYPGIGWVIWKDEAYLPKELIFTVSYLGGEMPTMAINFSRSASQIIGQYYVFLRNGFEGFRAIHQKTSDVAKYIAKEIVDTGYFELYNNAEHFPLVCYKLKPNADVTWTLDDLTDRLAMKGWQVPTYPLPANLTNIDIQRIVCRADLTMQMAMNFMQDFKEALEILNGMKIECISGKMAH